MPPPNRKFLAACCALALSACALGPNFKPPSAPAGTGYLMPGDDAPSATVALGAPQSAAAWWTSFGSPALDSVVEQAVAGNQDLAKAEATLAEAKAQEGITRGAGWPSLDANGGAEREKINLAAFGFNPAVFGISNPTITLFSIGGAISYNLDLFGARRRRIESAAAHSEEESERAEAAYLTLTGRVASQAILIASLKAQLAAAEAIVSDDQKNVAIVKHAVEAGGEPQATLTSASTQLATDEADLPPLRQSLAEARHGLAALVGKTPAAWQAPDFELASFAAPAAVPVSLPSEIVRKRPDILAAQSALHSALADVGAAEADRFPKLDLGASMLQQTTDASNIFSLDSSAWTLGSSLTAPLFHGGALAANEKAKKAAAEASLADYRSTVLSAFVQVADLIEAAGHDRERVDALTLANTSAARNLYDARRGFEEGGKPFINVLDAQRLENQTAEELAAAKGQELADMALLFVATAADWRAPQAAKSADTSPPPALAAR